MSLPVCMKEELIIKEEEWDYLPEESEGENETENVGGKYDLHTEVIGSIKQDISGNEMELIEECKGQSETSTRVKEEHMWANGTQNPIDTCGQIEASEGTHNCVKKEISCANVESQESEAGRGLSAETKHIQEIMGSLKPGQAMSECDKVNTENDIKTEPTSNDDPISLDLGKSHRCDICKQTFGLDTFRTHKCDEDSPEKANAEVPELLVTREYAEDTWAVPTGIDSSLNTLPRNPKKQAKKHSCETCQKKFTARSDLEKHIRTHNREKPFTCEECKKQFTQKSSLVIHIRIHTGEKPYACDICNKRFSDNSDLLKHNRVHTQEKPFSCDVCNKQFTLSTTLTDHKRTHTGEKPFKCEVCKKQFTRHSHLNKHMRIHTGKKPFSCNICEKQFAVKASLNTHMRQHTGERLFTCEICKKYFSRNTTLVNHMRIHTGEKPFSCELCDKKYKDRAGLAIHVRVHNGEKPYSCDVCNMTFAWQYKLTRHKESHEDKPKFSCDICKKRFPEIYYLNKHKKTHKTENPGLSIPCDVSDARR